MAELYVRLVDQGGYKSGDIVVIKGDGYQWSNAERSNSRHRIVHLSGQASDYEILESVHYKPDHELMGFAATMIPSLVMALTPQMEIKNRRRYGLSPSNEIVSKGA